MTSPRSGAEVTLGRRAALEILGAVERGQRLDRAFAASSRALDPRERGWCRELTYGVQRLRGRLDHLLDRKVQRGLDSVDPAVRDALRLGLYQILYMDGVPEYASVSQAVDLARSVGGKGVAGFVNAVLRAAAGEGGGEEHFPDAEADPAGFLSTWGSHPRWLVERWLGRWSPAEVWRLVQANNAVPPIYLRCLRDTPEEAVELLAGAGIEAEPVGSGTGCVALLGESPPVEAMAAVPSVVQDPAAALVAPYADPEPGDLVADLCAAPGGKAMALAARGNVVLAADRSLERLRLVRDNAERLAEGPWESLGFRVSVVQADALAPIVEGADMALLDVPCTGTGTLRRNPDARWKLTPERLKELVALQERILEACTSVVPSGGWLVYSTCSLEPEENEDRISAFLERHPEFELEPSSGVSESYLDERGQLYVLPQGSGFDGAFAARLRKRSGSDEARTAGMRLGSSIRRRRRGGRRRLRATLETWWHNVRSYRPSRGTWGVVASTLLVGFGLGYVMATRVLFSVPPRSRDLFEIPDVRGVDRAAALQAVQAAGLHMAVVDSFSHPTAVRGQVLGQSPLAGQLSLAGDTVNLTLSLGPVRRPVPDVVRLREGSARNVLEASGFTVAVDSLEADLPAGRVVEVLPEPGTEVDLPMEVRIAVSTGPPLVAMPLLLGIEQTTAEAMLDSLGFVVSEILTRFRFGRDRGRVVEQDPQADSLLPPGSPVRLVIGRRSNRRRNRRN